MRVALDVDADFVAHMAEEELAGRLGVTAAVASSGRSLKAGWRSQITGTGLGARLARTIRERTYPEGRPSLRAASVVWTKAPEIVDSHDRGATIRAADGLWLSIPLPAAGKSLRGGRITPGEWERRTGRRLRFVYRRGRPSLLVDDGKVLPGARTMGRDGFSRAARGSRIRAKEPVPVFLLVPQVRLKKRLDLDALARAAEARLPGLIVAEWRRFAS